MNQKLERPRGLGEGGREQHFAHKYSANYTTLEIIEQFRQAMRDAGIHYSGEIVADGILNRFHIEGQRRGSKNGAYVLHLDGYPAGWFQDYTTGISQTWRADGGNDRLPLAVYEEIEKARHQRAEELHQKNKAAATKALDIWRRSKPITSQSEHLYLIKKQIQPHGTRLYKDALAIPMRDKSNKLINLQLISLEGEKRFLSGGKKKGCFCPIGNGKTKRTLIVEGFATGASLHEETSESVIVAFDSGNLLHVAKNIRELEPDAEIIICGDNDLSGVGQQCANKAAAAIEGTFLIPKMPGMDWNDVLTGGRHE